MFAAALLAALPILAAKKTDVEDWVNPAVNGRNRVEMNVRFRAGNDA